MVNCADIRNQKFITIERNIISVISVQPQGGIHDNLTDRNHPHRPK